MTPEERAKEIYDKLANGTEVRCVALRLVMVDYPDLKWAFEELIATAIREARNEALEEAAGVARETYTGSNGRHTAARIRALKGEA